MKEALIEQLAERRFGTGFGAFNYTELTEHGKEQYRSLVRQDWPLIVAFVATWLTETSEDPETNAQMDELARAWRQEMGQ